LEVVPEAVGGVADHVHLLLGLRATHRLADVVRDLKRVSSSWVHETIGDKQFEWQDGYGAFYGQRVPDRNGEKLYRATGGTSHKEKFSGGIPGIFEIEWCGV
jgi:REP element-mobilizing transposase RayT